MRNQLHGSFRFLEGHDYTHKTRKSKSFLLHFTTSYSRRVFEFVVWCYLAVKHV